MTDIVNLSDVGRRYEFKATNAATAEIFLYGPIGEDFFGDGIGASAFQKELKALKNPRTIDLHVDSPGGSVNDARTIYTLLAEHRAKVNIFIDGIAASAASFVAMAGDTIAIAEGGLFMIHNARAIARGTSADMERAAQLLKTIDETIAQTYVARTSQSKKQVLDWMRAETWFTGEEAVAAKFADRLMENKKLEASASPELLAEARRQYPDDFKRLPKVLEPKYIAARNAKNRAKRILENA